MALSSWYKQGMMQKVTEERVVRQILELFIKLNSDKLDWAEFDHDFHRFITLYKKYPTLIASIPNKPHLLRVCADVKKQLYALKSHSSQKDL